MKFKAYFIVILVNMVVGYMLFFYSQVDHHENELKWDRERDSLTSANKLIGDSLRLSQAESIAHEQRAESLATVPRTIYITNAQSLTRNASVDSLWLMLLTDPFVAVPETLVHHGQP